jgi:kinesin family protein C2/C3
MEDEVISLRQELEEIKNDLLLKTNDYEQLVQASSQIESLLEKALEESENRVDKWRHQAERLESDVAKLHEKLAVNYREAGSMQNELLRYKQQTEILSREKMQWETTSDNLTTQIRILEASTEELTHKLERVIEEKVFLQNDYDDIEKQHELSSERFRSEIRDLKSELFALQLKQRVLGTSTPTHQLMMSLSGEEPESALREQFLSQIDNNPLRPSSWSDRDKEEIENHIRILEKEIQKLTHRLKDEEDRRGQLEYKLVQMAEKEAHMSALETEISEMSDELIEKSGCIKRAGSEVLTRKTTYKILKCK